MMTATPWGKPAEGTTFNAEYPTEFRASGIPECGNGWWAKVDIPKNTRLRRVAVDEGSLIRVDSLEELQASGWGLEDSVNYGIGHKKSPQAIYFLNPGTACNHADPSREVSIRYFHSEKDVFELWTVKDVKAGEEMFISYSRDFGSCKWFDDFHNSAGRVPLSQLGDVIDSSMRPLDSPPEGAIEMKVTLRKSRGFYVKAALSFLRGIEARPATDEKAAAEAKPPVCALRVSGTGEACNVAISAAAAIATSGIGRIVRVQTNYPSISGVPCPQIVIDLRKT